MKNIKFFLLSLIAVTLLFSACSDLSKDTSGNQKKSQYTVLGSLSLAGVSRAVYSRTATTAFSDEPVWTISATKGEKSYLPNEFSDLAFNFTFDEAGEYLIEATALKAGKIIAQGSCLCMVSEDEENFASIIAKPVASILPGSINLEINFDSYSANKVSSVQVEWLGFVNIDRTKQALGYPSGAELTGDEKEPEISEEVQTAIAALIDWEEQRSEGKFNKTLPVESGKAVIEMDNIFCGAHTVKLSFSDSVGNTLYSCKEILNVYSGFTTNEWYGTAPYLNNGTFTLTSTLVEKYGTDRVPSTDYMLYDYNSSESEFDYYFMDDYTKSLPATATLTSSYNSIGFDSDGYYYILSKILGSATYIKSNKPDFGSETVSNTQDPGAMYVYGDLGQYLLVDRKTDFLYMIDKSNAEFTQITNDDGTYDYDSEDTVYNPAKRFRIQDTESNRSIIINSSAFAIYGGIGYFAFLTSEGSQSEASIQIAVVDFNHPVTSDDDLYISASNVYVIHETGFSQSATCSDLIYQDGSIYILVRDVIPSDGDVVNNQTYSRGALIIYNTLLGTTKTIGYAPSTELTEFKAAITGDNVNPLYKDSYHNELFTYDFTAQTGYSFTINAPYDSESSYFVGPEKFIAIKPKKLVIADTGLAFYTDSDLIYKKKVNRVVEIDLESLSMENADITLVENEFNPEYAHVFIGSGFQLNIFSDDHCYESSGSEFTGSVNPIILEK